MAKLVATADGVSSRVKVKRPRFKDLWMHYPPEDAEKVYKLIGGNVYEAYLEGKKKNSTAYENACALRLSRAFNYGGLVITRASSGYKLKGGDGKAYFLKVNDMISFVSANFGKPELDIMTNGADKRAEFAGRKGIIIFKVEGWGNSTGHVTLWDGSDCGDSCYFTHKPRPPSPPAKTTQILFWDLK